MKRISTDDGLVNDIANLFILKYPPDPRHRCSIHDRRFTMFPDPSTD